MQPNVESREVKSQATPLAGDVLDVLRKQITGGTFGEGFGPLQREAGTAIQQFTHNRADPANFAKLMGPLREMFNTQTDRGAAQVREGMGAAGNRFSTSTMREEGRFRGERANALDAQIGQMFQESQNQLLQGLGMMQNFGAQNVNPFFQMASQGINPENQIVTEDPIMQILKLAAPVAGMALGKPPI